MEVIVHRMLRVIDCTAARLSLMAQVEDVGERRQLTGVKEQAISLPET